MCIIKVLRRYTLRVNGGDLWEASGKGKGIFFFVFFFLRFFLKNYLFYLCIYSCIGSVAAHRLSLVAASRGLLFVAVRGRLTVLNINRSMISTSNSYSLDYWGSIAFL